MENSSILTETVDLNDTTKICQNGITLLLHLWNYFLPPVRNLPSSERRPSAVCEGYLNVFSAISLKNCSSWLRTVVLPSAAAAADPADAADDDVHPGGGPVGGDGGLAADGGGGSSGAQTKWTTLQRQLTRPLSIISSDMPATAVYTYNSGHAISRRIRPN